jgi:sulfur carrier protein ThiS
MAIKLTYRDKKWELAGAMSARDALKTAGLNPEEVLVVRNGQLVTEDTVLQEGDEVKLVAVISGGEHARRS